MLHLTCNNCRYWTSALSINSIKFDEHHNSTEYDEHHNSTEYDEHHDSTEFDGHHSPVKYDKRYNSTIECRSWSASVRRTYSPKRLQQSWCPFCESKEPFQRTIPPDSISNRRRRASYRHRSSCWSSLRKDNFQKSLWLSEQVRNFRQENRKNHYYTRCFDVWWVRIEI